MFENVKFDFSGKNVLVVGGSRGIGRHVVESFIDAGANVYSASRKKNVSEVNAQFIQVDLEDVSSVEYFFDDIFQNQPLDILINSASINFSKKADEIDLAEWNSVLSVNLTSMFLVCKAALKTMVPNGSGKIVNISSIAAKRWSVVSGVHYVASKAGLLGLTRQLSYEFARHNININALCPSQTMTDMLKETMTKDEIAKLVESIPNKRLASVEEQIGVIMFLCSDAASYITGACIDVNGGQL